MAQKYELRQLAIFSRIAVWFLQFLGNLIIPDHDAHVFRYIRTDDKENPLGNLVNYTLGGFIRWDAEYFMHIAKYGYTYENSLAFFPLLPSLVRIITDFLMYVYALLNLDEALLLVFIIFNILVFVLTVKSFYKLSRLIFHDSIAYKSTVLFCFNPASIFFTSPYTECLFCYLTFESIYCCVILLRKYSNESSHFNFEDTKVLLFISLSTITRSNGLLNTGFIIYTILCVFFTYFPKTGVSSYCFKYSLIIFSCCVFCCVPFTLYQIYCFRKFCSSFKAVLPDEVINFARSSHLILPGQFGKFNQSWCYQTLPLAYSYVQDKYWNVGFLRYYELKKIPNFLLASPCLYVMLKNCWTHLCVNRKNLLGVFDLKRLRFNGEGKTVNDLRLTVFVLHGLFLSVFCLLCVHVEVTTRMICSSTPLFYWYCTFHYAKNNNRIILVYFFGYLIVGTVMFCNNLPWT